LAFSVRGFALVFVYLFAAVGAASVLAWLLAGVLDYAYMKILSRSLLLFLAIGLIPLWRAADLSAKDIGLSPMRAGQALKAYPYGVAMVIPLMLFFVVVGFRVWDDRVDYAGAEFWSFVVVGIVSGLLVGVFEETLFRGILFGVLRRSGSFVTSAIIVGTVYALVHFLVGAETEVAAASWYTGFIQVGGAFNGLGDPAGYVDSFGSLLLLGVLLCLVRERLGLWWCIGLHAAWVFSIRLFKEMTVRDIYSPYEVLVGDYDNFIGNLVSVWLIFIFVVLALHRSFISRPYEKRDNA